MKNLFYFVVLFCLTVSIASCSSNESKKEGPSQHDLFVSSLTKADTTEVLELCEQFFAQLKAGEKEAAFSMLSLSNEEGEVIAMTDEKKQSLNRQFTLFPVLDNHIVDYTFGEAADNLVRFKVVFGKDEQGKEDAINFGLNPIRKDGKWYLTVRNASAKVAE